MKHLEDVAPAHAVDALALILGLQATDPTASTTVRDPGEAVGRHVADSLSALELPYVAGARRDRRPRVRRRAGPGWRSLRRSRTRTSGSSRARSAHCRYLERAVELSGLTNAPSSTRGSRSGHGAARRRHRPRAGRVARPRRVRRAAAGAGRALRGLEGRRASPEEAVGGRRGGRRSSGWSRSRSSGRAVRGRARSLAARVPEDRRDAGAVPAPRGHGHQAPARVTADAVADNAFHVKHPCRSDRPRR